MFRSLIRLAAFVCIPLASFLACGDSVFLGQAQPPAPELFVSPDASTEATTTRELTEYCASNKCPTGFTTCSTSTFLCDVDLRSDRNHCGACGAACPSRTAGETYDCIEGRCVMRCREPFKDCDGLVDNGCESRGDTNDACGACGKTCADPETAPCLAEHRSTYDCGCPDSYSYCKPANPWEEACHDLKNDDTNCGQCGTVCDPAGWPGAPPPPPNAYYGCALGKCNYIKCKEGRGDCNKDLGNPGSDGCEVNLSSHENCTSCGDNCLAEGMHCVYTPFQGLACRCPPGENFCGISSFGEISIEPFIGSCANFTTDPSNCGACGVVCPGTTTRSRGVCEYGACKLECSGRWADCNGNLDDDCEVDTFGDPQNCGGCGITCDIAAGQACAGGRCVMEPCKEEEEVSR